MEQLHISRRNPTQIMSRLNQHFCSARVFYIVEVKPHTGSCYLTKETGQESHYLSTSKDKILEHSGAVRNHLIFCTALSKFSSVHILSKTEPAFSPITSIQVNCKIKYRNLNTAFIPYGCVVFCQNYKTKTTQLKKKLYWIE